MNTSAMIPGYITKGDFVRIVRHGPSNLTEYLWYYLYGEGVFVVPLNWHLAVLAMDIGMPIVKLLSPIVNWLTSKCEEVS